MTLPPIRPWDTTGSTTRCVSDQGYVAGLEPIRASATLESLPEADERTDTRPKAGRPSGVSQAFSERREGKR